MATTKTCDCCDLREQANDGMSGYIVGWGRMSSYGACREEIDLCGECLMRLQRWMSQQRAAFAASRATLAAEAAKKAKKPTRKSK